VTVSAASTVLQPTLGVQATAVTKDSANNVLTGRIINWSSSNTRVASISPLGYIIGQAAGTDTITAVSEGKYGTLIITVPAVATISVTSPQSNLQPTQTTQATAVLLDASAAAATNRTIVWTSSNTSVATVSATGLVTAVAGGTATISATSEGVTGTKTIVVPPVATVTLAVPITSLIPLQTSQAVATLLDATASPATNRSIIWTSSAPSVAMVSSNGLVTGLAIGSAVITATSEGKSGSVTVTVVQPTVASIQINALHTQLLLSQTSQLGTVIIDNNGKPTTTITPTWTSSNPTKATISPTGLITAVGGGTSAVVTFTAAVGNVSATTTMTIIGHAVETVAALPQVFLNTAMLPATGGGRTDHQRRSWRQFPERLEQRAARRRHRARQRCDVHWQLHTPEQEYDERELDRHSPSEQRRPARRGLAHDSLHRRGSAVADSSERHESGRDQHRTGRTPLSYHWRRDHRDPWEHRQYRARSLR
jgi:uncharacterized protein YjdB